MRSSFHLWMIRYTLLASPALFAILGAGTRPFVILESEPTPELMRQLRETPGLWLLSPAGFPLPHVPGTGVVGVVRGRGVPVLARLRFDPIE